MIAFSASAKQEASQWFMYLLRMKCVQLLSFQMSNYWVVVPNPAFLNTEFSQSSFVAKF